MATSEARIEANRRNAQRSTGPKTAEGKAASRWNAVRHGLAGSDDLALGAAEAAQVEARAAALAREMGPVGEAGAILVRRAAVLSLRMEGAARRELVAVARDRAEAIAAFDRERIALAAAPLAVLRAGAATAAADLDDDAALNRERAALRDLAALPEGIAPLIELWNDLARALGHPDAATSVAAREQARRWLGLAQPVVAGWSTHRWAERVAVEVERLRGRDDALEPARQAIARLREEAGDLATFDPSPDACLARRYEAAAQNGFFRILRALRDQRRDEATAPPIVSPPPKPSPSPTPAPPEPQHSPTVAAVRDPRPAALGSFRNPVLAPPSPPAPPAPNPPADRSEHRKHRPDPRKLVAGRR